MQVRSELLGLLHIQPSNLLKGSVLNKAAILILKAILDEVLLLWKPGVWKRGLLHNALRYAIAFIAGSRLPRPLLFKIIVTSEVRVKSRVKYEEIAYVCMFGRPSSQHSSKRHSDYFEPKKGCAFAELTGSRVVLVTTRKALPQDAHFKEES